MHAGGNFRAPGFNPHHSYRIVAEEVVEKSDRIAASAHAGDEHVGQAFLNFEDLFAGLTTDDGLEIAAD